MEKKNNFHVHLLNLGYNSTLLLLY